MTPPDGYRVVDVPFERNAELTTVNRWGFPSGTPVEKLDDLPWPLDFSRARGIETGDGVLAAIHASYAFGAFPVPGTTTAVSGLTWVTVHPAHRRRGLLSAMIADHFSRSLARGEAVSALWASEMGIYGRFGYGQAARAVGLTLSRGADLRDVPGWQDVQIRIEEWEPEQYGPLVRELHRGVPRPGWTTWETEGLAAMNDIDPEFWRDGFESQRIVLAERDGVPVGYARFRRKLAWEPTGPAGTVRVRDVVGADGAVHRALWGVLLDLDLTAKVEAWSLAPDDPVTHLLVDLNGASPRVGDNLWVRLLDLPAALATRRYAAPVDVVLEVTDARLEANAGRWHLVGGPDGAEVTRTDADPHLALDVREIGAAYLGGISLAALGAAGLVRELAPGSLATTATAFSWPLAPVSSWVW